MKMDLKQLTSEEVSMLLLLLSGEPHSSRAYARGKREGTVLSLLTKIAEAVGEENKKLVVRTP